MKPSKKTWNLSKASSLPFWMRSTDLSMSSLEALPLRNVSDAETNSFPWTMKKEHVTTILVDYCSILARDVEPMSTIAAAIDAVSAARAAEKENMLLSEEKALIKS